MKKITRFGLSALVIAGLFVSMSGFAQAATNTLVEADASVTGGGMVMNSNAGPIIDELLKNPRLDAKLKVELESTLKTGFARCDKTTKVGTTGRADCYKALRIDMISKLDGIGVRYTAPAKDVSGIRGESVRSEGSEGAVEGKIMPRPGMDTSRAITPRSTENNDQNLVDRLTKNIERLEAFIVRFREIGTRLDSRIAKLNAQGVDTSESAKLLVRARLDIDAAEKARDNAKIAFESELNTANAGATTDATIIYNKQMFAKYCAGVPTQLTETPQCLVGGTTYVNSDRKPDGTIAGQVGVFTKTRTYINESGAALIRARTSLLLSTNSLRPGVNKVGTEAGAGTVTEVGN